MEITVKSNYIKTSPRKMRLLTNLVKKCRVEDAIAQVKFSHKQTKYPLVHILKSAIAAAKEKGMEEDSLVIKSITCNQGPALKRIIFWSKGRAKKFKKRMCHINLTVTDKKATKTETKKPEIKKITDKKKIVTSKKDK